MREDLKEEGGGLSSEPPRCLLQLPVQDASRRPDWPDRKSPASAGNCGGGRKGHVTSTHHQLFPNLVSTARLAPGSFPQFPKVPREISSPVGPSSKRTGDRFTG